MSDFVCVTIPKHQEEKFDDALSDVLCWMNGFISGGGHYSPETLGVLKDVRDMIRRAYPTIPPAATMAAPTEPFVKKGKIK